MSKSSNSSSENYRNYGITLSFLKTFIDENNLKLANNADKTTEEVKTSIVINACSSGKSYIEKFSTQNTKGAKYFGEATHFVSHTYKGKFLDLYQALVDTYGHLDSEDAPLYFWIDLFSHDAITNNGAQYWIDLLEEIIKRSRHFCLIMSPFAVASGKTIDNCICTGSGVSICTCASIVNSGRKIGTCTGQTPYTLESLWCALEVFFAYNLERISSCNYSDVIPPRKIELAFKSSEIANLQGIDILEYFTYNKATTLDDNKRKLLLEKLSTNGLATLSDLLQRSVQAKINEITTPAL